MLVALFRIGCSGRLAGCDWDMACHCFRTMEHEESSSSYLPLLTRCIRSFAYSRTA
jgi:hypothetical protein